MVDVEHQPATRTAVEAVRVALLGQGLQQCAAVQQLRERIAVGQALQPGLVVAQAPVRGIGAGPQQRRQRQPDAHQSGGQRKDPLQGLLVLQRALLQGLLLAQQGQLRLLARLGLRGLLVGQLALALVALHRLGQLALGVVGAQRVVPLRGQCPGVGALAQHLLARAGRLGGLVAGAQQRHLGACRGELAQLDQRQAQVVAQAALQRRAVDLRGRSQCRLGGQARLLRLALLQVVVGQIDASQGGQTLGALALRQLQRALQRLALGGPVLLQARDDGHVDLHIALRHLVQPRQ